jgi:2'-5' RNA ligase
VIVLVNLDEAFLLYVPPGWNRLATTHISLSRTVYLPYFQIDQINRVLKERLGRMDLSRGFPITLQNSCQFENDERTRSFLALTVIEGSKELECLVRDVDEVFGRFGLPEFYHPPRFHCSYAWKTNEMSSSSSEIDHPPPLDEFPTLKFHRQVLEIQYRIGHFTYSINLES